MRKLRGVHSIPRGNSGPEEPFRIGARLLGLYMPQLGFEYRLFGKRGISVSKAALLG